MRCFVALELPAAMRRQLHAQAAPLRQLGDVRWVGPEQLHVTLKFLGDVDDAAVEGVRQTLAALPLLPLRLWLAGLGSFPKRGAPRVIWAGLGGDVAGVVRLAQQFEAAAAHHGVEREQRPFTAHVTLGRARSPRQSLMLQRAIEATSAAVTSPPFEDFAVTLFRSELSRDGAQHTRLASRPIG